MCTKKVFRGFKTSGFAFRRPQSVSHEGSIAESVYCTAVRKCFRMKTLSSGSLSLRTDTQHEQILLSVTGFLLRDLIQVTIIGIYSK